MHKKQDKRLLSSTNSLCKLTRKANTDNKKWKFPNPLFLIN